MCIICLNRLGRLNGTRCTSMDRRALSMIHAVLWSLCSMAFSRMVHRMLNCFLAWCGFLMVPSSSMETRVAKLAIAFLVRVGIRGCPT